MTIELTDADALALLRLTSTSTENIPAELERGYRAGIAAGLERAATVCDMAPLAMPYECAAAIRSLLK